MFYENWMSYLKDEAPLCRVAMPGSHNAGTYEMIPFCRCQDGTLYDQYRYGVRYFDFRFHIGYLGKPVFEHGVMGGTELEKGLKDIRRMISNNDSEFFIFKIHFPEAEYLIGKIGRRFKQNFEPVNKLFAEYLAPDKYAFSDFDDISDVSLGDIRKSGKRYILNWDNPGIYGAVNTPVYDPWRPDWYGKNTGDFFNRILEFFHERPNKSIFCLYTQRTPGIGTQTGLRNPRKLEREVGLRFGELTEKIASDSFLLENVNALTGDYMTESHYKSNMILRLNLMKNYIKEEYADLFKKMTAV